MRSLYETKIVKIKDIDFTIGIINPRIFRPIKERYFVIGKFLGRLSKEEIQKLSPAELGQKVAATMTTDELLKNEDLAFGAQWDMVKFGVRSHAGCKDADGKEMLLVKDDGGCLTDETISIYELNGLLAPLANEIFIFNTMSEDQKKN